MSRCPECAATFSPNGGGHCRGGAYGGCCRTFTSDVAFDRHRSGSYATRRTCIDVSVAEGWRLTKRGWTDAKPMTTEALAARIGTA